MKKKNEMKKFSNIKDLRKLLRLTQGEFAELLGVSQVYISQIENYNKHLKPDLAEKTAKELINIVGVIFHIEVNRDQSFDPLWELIEFITPYQIRVEHEASRYSSDMQNKLYRRMVESRKLDLEIDYILENGKEPIQNEMSNYVLTYDSIEPIKDIINYTLELKSSKEVLDKLKTDLQKESVVSSLKSGKGFKRTRR